MTYEEAKPFVEKLYNLALFYHSQPNELRRRLYEAVDDIAVAEREACAKVCEEFSNINSNMNQAWRNGCRECAVEIRERRSNT